VITGKVTGIDDAIRRMKAMKASAERKLVRAATTKAMRAAQKDAKRNAPVDRSGRYFKGEFYKGGSLKKAIGIRTRTYAKTGMVVVLVGVRKLDNQGKLIPSNYHHLVELGTDERWQKTTGRYTGSVKATHFLRDALVKNRNHIVGTTWAEIIAGLNKEARK